MPFANRDAPITSKIVPNGTIHTVDGDRYCPFGDFDTGRSVFPNVSNHPTETA